MRKKMASTASSLTIITLILTLFLSPGVQGMPVAQKPTSSRNLLNNASFEAKTDAPVEMPEAWQPNTWGSGLCTLNRTSSQAYSGSWSGEIAGLFSSGTGSPEF